MSPGRGSATANIVTTKNDYSASSTVGTGDLAANVFGGKVGRYLGGGMLNTFAKNFAKAFKTGNAFDSQSTSR